MTDADRALMLQVLKRFRVLLRSMDAHYRQVERRSGLGGAQLWALAEIAGAGRITVGQLAKKLAIHLSTASNLVRRLESLGLVARARLASDQRVVQLAATAAGRRKVRSAPKPSAGLLQQALLEMEARELRALTGQLEKVLRRMGGLDKAGGATLLSEMLGAKKGGG